jgi:hypothetical protein
VFSCLVSIDEDFGQKASAWCRLHLGAARKIEKPAMTRSLSMRRTVPTGYMANRRRLTDVGRFQVEAMKAHGTNDLE